MVAATAPSGPDPSCCWALHAHFFADTSRRTMIAASVTDEAWAAEVAPRTDGPYLFMAEALPPYLHEPDVRRVVDLLSGRFPGSLPALDTAGPGFFDIQQQHDALGKVAVRMHWHCPDPAGMAAWRPGVQMPASYTLPSLPGALVGELPVPYQEMLSALAVQRLSQAEGYRLNLLRLP